jgi:hypothetical protein
MPWWTLFFFACGLSFAQSQEAWDFTPSRDAFDPAAAFDWRSMNEPVAGQDGFVRADKAGDFVLGSGLPARFWGVTTYVGREPSFVRKPLGRQSEPDLAYHARFLAKRGVNLVKVLAAIYPDAAAQPDAPLEAINPADREWIWKTVAAMKKEGIYTTITFYWPASAAVNPAWGLGTDDLQGLLFFEPRMQAAYRSWLRQLFAEKNPYTGLTLAEDPSIAFITLVHEDSLLFWTIEKLKGANRALLAGRFKDWVKEKYGSLDEARRAWNNEKVAGDTEAQFGFLPAFQLLPTGNANARRSADQTEFLTQTMRQFYAGTTEFLRKEIGFKPLINAGNWRPLSEPTMFDAERFAYGPTDIDGFNRYFGAVHQGAQSVWMVGEGDLLFNRSVLREPSAFPLNIRQVEGRPFIMNESSWTAPNAYVAEGPLMVAAYSALIGFDGFLWYATKDDDWSPPQSANGYTPGLAKWDIATPDTLGQFPGDSLLFRRGDVKRAESAFHETRNLSSLWNRELPAVPESTIMDPNPAAKADGGTSGNLSTATQFLAGPVHVGFSTGKVAPPPEHVPADTAGGLARSPTKELALDWKKNVFTLDTPTAQGAAAFFAKAGPIKTRDLQIESSSPYGTVLAISLDSKPLADSRRVLVQLGSVVRPKGFLTERAEIKLPDGQSLAGEKILKTGTAPWTIAYLEGTLALNNPHLTKATLLDANGMPQSDAPVIREKSGVQINLRQQSLYLLLEAGKDAVGSTESAKPKP